MREAVLLDEQTPLAFPCRLQARPHRMVKGVPPVACWDILASRTPQQDTHDNCDGLIRAGVLSKDGTSQKRGQRPPKRDPAPGRKTPPRRSRALEEMFQKLWSDIIKPFIVGIRRHGSQIFLGHIGQGQGACPKEIARSMGEGVNDQSLALR